MHGKKNVVHIWCLFSSGADAEREFVLAGSLQVRYNDTPAVQIVLHDMSWSLFWRQFVVWPAASAVGIERPWHSPTKATAEQHVSNDAELFAVCPNFELRNHIVDCYNSPAWHRWWQRRSSSRRRWRAVVWCDFLFVYEISREPLNGVGPNSQGRHVWSLAGISLNVKVKGQGHHEQKRGFQRIYR